ncbi:type III secretion system (T3SS) SseB-like protein [Pacificibacter maritimus]|uniref:Type III secretion system (T3SS) SseB-like protein n=1 Tax=Pacificibacter maritimus TaxID=762213 RepID=A0A3N4U9P8_9RHOB|nr:SseB family protein [Pacificibacter maritimus]RPE67456.1 type III secretion system (T3SS) SseB-like protein [Pacificibacter maritimus]
MTDQPSHDITPIDLAHAAMEAAPNDDTERLRFFERLADGELFLLLEKEHQGDAPIEPRVFPVEDQSYVLVFDREERLAEFAGSAPYAALSGRVLAGMLAGQGIGLGVNLTVAPSEILLPPDAMDWLKNTLDHAPSEAEAKPEEITPPHGLPERLITALDAKLAIAGGLARVAYLAGVTYEGGAKSHLLAYVDTVPGADGALAQLVAEALTFSGIEAGALDVAFFDASDPLCATLARHGLRFDLPEPEQQSSGPSAPGMDPSKPPILR